MPRGPYCNGACQCQSEQEEAQSTKSKMQARYCYFARFHGLFFEPVSLKAGELKPSLPDFWHKNGRPFLPELGVMLSSFVIIIMIIIKRLCRDFSHFETIDPDFEENIRNSDARMVGRQVDLCALNRGGFCFWKPRLCFIVTSLSDPNFTTLNIPAAE